MTDQTLSIDIRLELHRPGPNRVFHVEHEVEVPPDYVSEENDFLPFFRHELERAVTALEVEQLGGARAARIIAAYDLRIRAIEFLLRTSPHVVRGSTTRFLIDNVINADNDTIFERWQDRLGADPED